MMKFLQPFLLQTGWFLPHPATNPMSSPGHEIQSFFTSYLVPHFSEVWNCGIVWQSKDIAALVPQSWTLIMLYLVPHFSEVWKWGIVWQTKDIDALSPSHEPSVILYLVPQFSEVWNCGKVWQSKDIVALFPLLRTLCHSLLSSTLLGGVEG